MANEVYGTPSFFGTTLQRCYRFGVRVRWAMVLTAVLGCGGKTAEQDPPGPPEEDAVAEERSPEDLAATHNCLCAVHFGQPIPLSPNSDDAQSCRFELSGGCPADEGGFNQTRCGSSGGCVDQVGPGESCAERPNSFVVLSATSIFACQGVCDRAAVEDIVLLVGCPID